MGARHPYFSIKNKAKQRFGVDLVLEKNLVNSNSQILKAFAAGQTNKASLPLRQCSNVKCYAALPALPKQLVRHSTAG